MGCVRSFSILNSHPITPTVFLFVRYSGAVGKALCALLIRLIYSLLVFSSFRTDSETSDYSGIVE